MASGSPADPLPSRQQLIQAVEFIKGEYQHLAQQLAEKNIRLEQLASSKGDTFEIEMENYQLRSQLNQQKMQHIEQVKQLTMQFNHELEEQQRLLEDKYKVQLARAQHRIRELQSRQSTASDPDSSMILTMKRKMEHTEELLNRLNNQYSAAMDDRNRQISRLERLMGSGQSHIVGCSEDVKHQHLSHISELEHKVGQLQVTLKQYENGRPSSVTVHESELHAALDQSQRLNNQLTVELQQCHRRIEQLSSENDTVLQHQLVNTEQLRNKQAVIHEQQLELQRLATTTSHLESKLLQCQTDKQRQLDEALRLTVDKFESKIGSIQRHQSERSDRLSLEPLQYSHRGSEIQSELRQLKRRVHDQNLQLENCASERDELLQRNRELETQMAGLIEQFRTRHQQETPEVEAELQKLRQQNNDYREKFTFLQKEAKKIVEEHCQTIEKLQIALEETNGWNKQLKEQEAVFSREYQALLKVNEQLTIQAREKDKSVTNSRQQLEIKAAVEGSEKKLQSMLVRNQELQGKLKEAAESAELNNQRLEFLKVSKKDSDRKLQELEGKAKEADKKLTSAENKLKKLNQSNDSLKEQLNHKEDEYKKLESHFEAVKIRHEHEINSLQKSFEEMNERLVQEKKLYDDMKGNLFAEKTAQYQRVNEHNLQLEGELKQQAELRAKLEIDAEGLAREKKEALVEVAKLRQEKKKLEESLNNKESLVKLKDKRIEELADELERLRQDTECQEQSIIIADKDRVYEYISELEEKCRLLQDFASEARKSEASLVASSKVTVNNQTASENIELRKQVDSLEREVVSARLQSNRISLQFERHKRQSMQELLAHKQSEEETTRQLYNEINRLNSIVEARRVENASQFMPQTPQFSPIQEQSTRPPSHSLTVSSIQSPLSFNTLPDRIQQSSGAYSGENRYNSIAFSFRQNPVDNLWLRNRHPDPQLAGSGFSASFGRRS